MFPYVTCWCGRSLGDLFPLYQELKRRKYEEYFKKTGIEIAPTRVPICTDVQIDVGDILDALHIKCECCRTRMISQIEFKEYY